MLVNFGQNIAPAQKPAPGKKVKTQPVVQLSQSEWLAFRISRQPDIGHASAIDQFLKIESPERARLGRGLKINLAVFSKRHPLWS